MLTWTRHLAPLHSRIKKGEAYPGLYQERTKEKFDQLQHVIYEGARAFERLHGFNPCLIP